MMKLENRYIPALTFLCMIIFSACTSVSKTALKKFVTEKPKLYVCPVHILTNNESTFNINSAKAIVEYLNKKNYADAEITQLQPPENNEWMTNEAKMKAKSNELFTEFVIKSNFPENSYILYVEFLKGGPNKSVRAVHYYLLNYRGEAAMVGLVNSVWKEFKEVNPKTNEDCVDLFLKVFENNINSKK